jgi:hypothetical protein
MGIPKTERAGETNDDDRAFGDEVELVKRGRALNGSGSWQVNMKQ